MLNTCQTKFIHDLAYIPEQLPRYLLPFSEREPRFHQGLLYYQAGSQLNIIAYPLPLEIKGPVLKDHIQDLVHKLRPRDLKVFSPIQLQVSSFKQARWEQDYYYCLDLNRVATGAKLRNMLKRASREAYTSVSRDFTREHLQIVTNFIRYKGFQKDKALFFHRLPEYLAHSETALILEARLRENNEIVAFDILETGARMYAFYLFNITDAKTKDIPGINDLLVQEMVHLAQDNGKRFINMGLGINPGIVSFKAKWGAFPFVPYHFQEFRPGFSWRRLLNLK